MLYAEKKLKYVISAVVEIAYVILVTKNYVCIFQALERSFARRVIHTPLNETEKTKDKMREFFLTPLTHDNRMVNGYVIPAIIDNPESDSVDGSVTTYSTFDEWENETNSNDGF